MSTPFHGPLPVRRVPVHLPLHHLHYLELADGTLAEVDVIVATAEQWAAMPRSARPGWSVCGDGPVVSAVQVVT